MNRKMSDIKRTRKCWTMENHRRLLKEVPEYRKNRIKLERFTKRYIERYGQMGLRTGIVRIPVVVHVIYHNNTENISDAQIQSQIDVLNQDYRRQNTDASNTPTVFQSVAADTRIEFGLAVRDPDCNATNGITRTSTNETSFSANDDMKFTANGGHDAWPRDKYLNIWVCNLSGGLMGYAQFPGGPADTDGVVIDYTYFGNTGTVSAPYDLGRTATHEIGHWFNLLHIWGDDGIACTGTDEVSDTPNQAGYNVGCPTFPHISCSNGPNGDMFMNYMDYTDDACMNMFTNGQYQRMDACLQGPDRNAILASDGLVPPPGVAKDLWSQNTPQDIGDEPDIISTTMCQTDDIWVRKQDDGLTTHEHENPEYRPAGYSPNYVYVRVRNRGCTQSMSGEVKLYWAKAGTSLSWPSHWDGSITTPALMGDQIGTQSTGNIAPGDFTILKFQWHPPNPADYSSLGADITHFCLLSRIETSSTPPYGMTTAEGSSIYQNVKNNNNIVWKNLHVVDEETESGKIAALMIGGPVKANQAVRIEFVSPDYKIRHTIFDWGIIILHLDKKLIKLWKEAGAAGRGIKEVDDGFAITMHGAWIGNIMLKPRDYRTIKMTFKPKSRFQSYDIHLLDVNQYTLIKKEKIYQGGMRYVVKTHPPSKYNIGTVPTLVFDGTEWIKKPTDR
jgi:hypothetical protein